MGENDTDPIMSRIEEALASRESTQSLLYRWMMANHDGFAGRLAKAAAEGKLPDWADLARRFGESGLTDGTGKPPNAANARRTWWRVKRRHAQLHGGGSASGKGGKAAGASPAGSAGEVAGVPDAEGDDALANVRAKINKRSGR